MKVVVIHGSPRRKNSATYKITERVIIGLKKKGATVEEIMLADKNIKHCIGCYTCWTKTPGVCVHKDDMVEILPKLQDADLIIHASPLYYYDVTGLFKNFVDRNLPLIEPWLIERENATGHPFRGGGEHPKVFLVSVCGFPERSHFDALVLRYEKAYDETVGGAFIGHFLVPAAEPLARGMENMFTEILNLAEKAGEELAINKMLSDVTNSAIIKATTKSKEEIKRFVKIANMSWESMQPKEKKEIPKEIKRVVNTKPLDLSAGGIDTFFAGMALQYKPSKKATAKGVLQFDMDGKSWHIVMDGVKAEAFKGSHPSPSMTIITPKKLWMEISDGTKDGQTEFMNGNYKVDGDMNYLMDMDKLFNASDEESEDSSVESSEIKSSKVAKTLPEKRGPIGLSGTWWMQIAFVPWMTVWIWGSISGGWLPLTVAAGFSLLLFLYHGITNRPVLFETGTAIYMTLSLLAMALSWNFFMLYQPMIDYLFLAGLWAGSAINYFTLTAEYSGQGYPPSILKTKAFTSTNLILSTSWGIYFLVASMFVLLDISSVGAGWIWMVARFALLVPMFIFTGWFQKWYPKKLLASK
jgi:putative sterol carrier protein